MLSMVENLAVCLYLLADKKPLLYAVLEKCWTTNTCMDDRCQCLYAPIESTSIFLCSMYLKMKVHALFFNPYKLSRQAIGR